MRHPYYFTSERVFTRQVVDFDEKTGIIEEERGGEHTIWAARIPFLPSMSSEDFTGLGQQRIPFIMHRQFRFIYDLSRAKENNATFELRFISTPNILPGQPNTIDIIFLGKVFATRRNHGQTLAEDLWEKFVSHFPVEEPFNYPLEPIVDESSFWECYQPISFNEIERQHVLEIRKYEEPPLDSRSTKLDYVVHPFVPNKELNPMGRFLATLATQAQRCYTSISIRPTRLYSLELHHINRMILEFRKTIKESEIIEGLTVEKKLTRKQGNQDGIATYSTLHEYTRTRSQIGHYIYQRLMQEREQLVMVRVHLVGEEEAPRNLAEALGSEMMGNADNIYPTQWALIQPADQAEMASVLSNIKYLEHDMWGHSMAAPYHRRLRYLCSAQEAYGAFRLPVPSLSGYIPGVLIKDEPFVAPADDLELRYRQGINPVTDSKQHQPEKIQIALGEVFHRGSSTQQQFYIDIKDLPRHMLIAGSTGSGKSTTIKHLLHQLWVDHKVPFLVLYPLDKPDYRDLYGLNGLKNDLLVFTLGDENTSPFRFNPFEVPEGLLLKTHLSRLMRVFVAAFELWDPLPMIYRSALRQVYQDKGWDIVYDKGIHGHPYPLMSDFYKAIEEKARSLDYAGEIKDNVVQASVIRIGDLLENAGHVVNVEHSYPFSTIMSRPTIMEVGRVGSTQDIALLMGFLLMRLAGEIERNPRELEHPHITVVEEAHRLMPNSTSQDSSGNSRNSASEDFSNILAEVRGHGEGLIIAEQIPTSLVQGAIGNTYLKIMHWLEDAPSFELFSDIMNLDTGQRKYARTLSPGFAVVRSPFSGRPAHIRVPYLETQATPEELSDEKIKVRMSGIKSKLGLVEMEPIPWKDDLGISERSSAHSGRSDYEVSRLAGKSIFGAPLGRVCALCQSLLASGRCLYRQDAFALFQISEGRELAKEMKLSMASNPVLSPDNFNYLVSKVAVLSQCDEQDTEGISYCFLAHVSHYIYVHTKNTSLQKSADESLQAFWRRNES